MLTLGWCHKGPSLGVCSAVLAGPHRYGNLSALIFVQMNSGTSKSHGRKTEKLVGNL